MNPVEFLLYCASVDLFLTNMTAPWYVRRAAYEVLDNVPCVEAESWISWDLDASYVSPASRTCSAS